MDTINAIVTKVAESVREFKPRQALNRTWEVIWTGTHGVSKMLKDNNGIYAIYKVAHTAFLTYAYCSNSDMSKALDVLSIGKDLIDGTNLFYRTQRYFFFKEKDEEGKDETKFQFDWDNNDILSIIREMTFCLVNVGSTMHLARTMGFLDTAKYANRIASTSIYGVRTFQFIEGIVLGSFIRTFLMIAMVAIAAKGVLNIIEAKPEDKTWTSRLKTTWQPGLDVLSGLSEIGLHTYGFATGDITSGPLLAFSWAAAGIGGFQEWMKTNSMKSSG